MFLFSVPFVLSCLAFPFFLFLRASSTPALSLLCLFPFFPSAAARACVARSPPLCCRPTPPLPFSLPRAALVHASIGAAPSSQPATSARPTLSDSVDIRSCLIHSTTCSNRNTLCSARARGRSCVSARWPLILQFMVDVNMRPRPCIWPAANFGANCCKSWVKKSIIMFLLKLQDCSLILRVSHLS